MATEVSVGTGMSDYERLREQLREAREKAEQWEREALRVERELSSIMPPEPQNASAIVWVGHASNGIAYSYASIKTGVGGPWYTTGGMSPQGTSWKRLVDFMRSRHARMYTILRREGLGEREETVEL